MNVIVDLANVLLCVMVKGRGQVRHYVLMREAVRARFPGDEALFVCDASARHKVDDKERFEAMVKDEGIIQTPAHEEADYFMLEFLRQEPDSIIISRDTFAKYKLDAGLKERVIPLTIIGQRVLLSQRAEKFTNRGIPIEKVSAFLPLPLAAST